ncbi:transcription factor VIP1, partial [Haematococcus lacustris]
MHGESGSPLSGAIKKKPGKSSSVNNGRTDQELQLLDPKKVKRILANRQSAAKSKERRQAHMSELEHELAAVQEESEALQTHRQELLGDLKVLEAYSSSLAAE